MFLRLTRIRIPLLDEAFNARLVRKLRRETRTTVLFATHNLDKALCRASRVIADRAGLLWEARPGRLQAPVGGSRRV